MKRDIHLGAVESIPLGAGRAFEVGEHTIAVFRTRDGRFYATQNRCPHAHSSLAGGWLGSTTIICPLHAYKFNLATGACLTDTAYRLRTYAVREEGGELFIAME